MSRSFFMNEGMFMDHAGNLISMVYVDMRHSNNRTPITSLIKGCRKQHAIELSGKIHISKPAEFRKFGECLINDLDESRHTKTTASKQTAKPTDVEGTYSINEERARALRLLGYNITPTPNTSRNIQETTESLTSGKNGWIFCTSVEPTNQIEKDKWQSSMDEEYDHISHINRPREFARALGLMAAEQLGPQGEEGKMTHNIGKENEFYTKHKTQVIYHGPVIYDDDAYDLVFNAATESEFALRPEFVKRTKFKNQLEYRFFVHAEKEPEGPPINLDVSLAMLESTKPHSRRHVVQVMPDPISSEEHSNQQKRIAGRDREKSEGTYGPNLLSQLRSNASFNEAIRNMANNPSTSITVCRCGVENLSLNLHEAATIQSVLDALRSSILGPFETRRVAGRRYVEASSSVWHAEPCIRHLCSFFEDPIKKISMTDDNFIMLHLKFPDDSQWQGTVIIGPQGTCRYEIKEHLNRTTGYPNNAWELRNQILGDLQKTDMQTRQDQSQSRHDNPDA